MQRSCVFTVLIAICLGSSARLDENDCDYVYEYACYTGRDTGSEIKSAEAGDSCSIDKLVDDIKFVVKLLRRRPRSSGVLEARFFLPDAPCRYEVALLVDTSATNDKECKSRGFRSTDTYEERIHSEDKSVCVLPFSNRTGEYGCKRRDKFSLWYEHVFTGCYALRFTIDGYKYALLGKRYIVTNYTRAEVKEPKFRCYYEDRKDMDESSQELVTFALSISVYDGTAGMILALTSMSYLEESKENACIRYSEPPLYTWKISMAEAANPVTGSKNCTMTTVQLDNETHTIDTECNFVLRVPRNASYCFKIELEDGRCNRQSVWRPPPDSSGGRPACIWLQRCTRIVKSSTTIVEYNGIPSDTTQIDTKDSGILLFLPIAVVILIVALATSTALFFVCRVFLARSARPIYVNANMRDLRVAGKNGESDSVETIEEELTQDLNAVNQRDEKNEPIVLLYARGTNAFMNLMADFREILETHCHCRVRDWYDGSEWDEVARVGPSAWVENLLRGKERAIWIDTPGARKLLGDRRKQNYSGYSEAIANGDIVGDFRDAALPTVLDSARRNVTSLEYNKHFVVRLEGFDVMEGREADPFDDLSPHTRYLLPHHLGELCSHLTSWTTSQRRHLKSEEYRLSQRLRKMSGKSSETNH